MSSIKDIDAKLGLINSRLAAIEALLAAKKTEDKTEENGVVQISDENVVALATSPTTARPDLVLWVTAPLLLLILGGGLLVWGLQPSDTESIIPLVGSAIVLVPPVFLVAVFTWLVTLKGPNGEVPGWAVIVAILPVAPLLLASLGAMGFWTWVRLEYLGFWTGMADYFTMTGQYKDRVI